MADTEPPESFVQEIRRALHHLHDPNELRSSALIRIFGLGRNDYPPAALRHLLSEAIERLKPGDVPAQTLAWRTYQVLYYRFCEQLTQHEVATDLGLSIRHLRRTETLAVRELARYLWEHHDLQPRGAEKPDTTPAVAALATETQTPSPQQELEWLHSSMLSTPVAVAEVVAAAVRLIRLLAHADGVDVQWHIAADLPRLTAQFTVLRHALVSLLTTAIQRSPQGQVEIGAALHDWSVCLTIEGHAGRKTEKTSGRDDERLSMARQLIELCGGSLDVRSGSDQGAFVARLTLPAAEHVPVLIVDDNADTLRLLQRYLMNSRYRFIGTTNPHQALALAQETHPQVIVLDVMLPDVDGWELLGRLHEHPQTCDVPIIICSILPEEQLASALGAAAFLRKPISREVFLAALDQQLGLVPSESRPSL